MKKIIKKIRICDKVELALWVGLWVIPMTVLISVLIFGFVYN